MDSYILTPIIFAILGGALPTFVWLFFWLKQDKLNPEPRKMIFLAFIGGMISVVIAMWLEKIAFIDGTAKLLSIETIKTPLLWLKDYGIHNNIAFDRVLLVSFFAPIIEECAKFLLAITLVLRSKHDDEPIDPVVYMITVALGFAAIENTLFLIDPFVRNELINGIMTGNLRFIGATVLHTMSSAILGLFIAFNFFDTKIKKFFWTIGGLLSAILVHIVFNFFMINNSTNSGFLTLQSLWIIVIIVLLLFEKIKKLRVEKI